MRRMFMVCAGLLSLPLAACVCGEPAGEEEAPTLEPVAALLPADVDVVASVSVDALYTEMVVKGLGMFPGRDDDGGLRDKLGKVFGRLLELDLAQTRSATLFYGAREGAFGAILVGDFGAGQPRGRPELLEGREAVRLSDGVVAARLGERLALGNREGVSALLQVAAGKAPALAGAPGLAAHERARDKVDADDAPLVISVRPGPFMKNVPPMLQGLQPEMVAFAGAAKGGERLAMTGSRETIQQLHALVKAGLAMARVNATELERQADRTESLGEALQATFVAHHLREAVMRLELDESDDALVAKLDLGGTSAVPLLAVLATVAIPAFLKYKRRAMTIDAKHDLDRVYEGAKAYYEHFGTE